MVEYDAVVNVPFLQSYEELVDVEYQETEIVVVGVPVQRPYIRKGIESYIETVVEDVTEIIETPIYETVDVPYTVTVEVEVEDFRTETVVDQVERNVYSTEDEEVTELVENMFTHVHNLDHIHNDLDAKGNPIGNGSGSGSTTPSAYVKSSTPEVGSSKSSPREKGYGLPACIQNSQASLGWPQTRR